MKNQLKIDLNKDKTDDRRYISYKYSQIDIYDIYLLQKKAINNKQKSTNKYKIIQKQNKKAAAEEIKIQIKKDLIKI